jgi:hypothetical protein
VRQASISRTRSEICPPICQQNWLHALFDGNGRVLIPSKSVCPKYAQNRVFQLLWLHFGAFFCTF